MGVIRPPTMRALGKDEPYVQPEGLPDTTTLNQRTMSAANRLNIKRVAIPMNPKITQYQLDALITVLGRKGILDQKDIDDLTYFTAYIQMLDLEQLVEHSPSLIVPAGATIGNGRPS